MKLSEQMLSSFKKIVPTLSAANKKGSYGKTCVIGGSFMYTGAPYHSAIAQLRSVR